jgi:hypothetical protein
MGFQTTVATDIGFGVIGEIAFDGPTRALSARIDSSDPANNVVGRAFCFTAGTDGNLVNAGGDPTLFAGILANPKVYASVGTVSGGPLAATLAVPDNTQGEFLFMGEITVALAAAANVGDLVTFSTATGVIGSVAQTASFTGVIAVTTGILTVSALAAGGYLAPGTTLSGTGVPAGTRITSQLTGTAGSNGTYQTNIITAVASTAMTAGNGALAAGASNVFLPNAVVSRYATAAAGLAVIKLTN